MRIDENTTIPLRVLILGIGITASFVLSFGYTTWTTASTGSGLDKLEKRVFSLEYSDRMQDQKFLEIIGEIKGELKILNRILDERSKQNGNAETRNERIRR